MNDNRQMRLVLDRPTRRTRTNVEASREEMLARVMERGKRDRSEVIELFPEKERSRYLGSLDDILLYGTVGFAIVSWVGLMMSIDNSEGGGHIKIVAAPPEDTPHDLWSFLASRSGRMAIDGAFRTAQRYLDKR